MYLFFTLFDHLIFLLLGRICLGQHPRKGFMFYCDWFTASASTYFVAWGILHITELISVSVKVTVLSHLSVGFAALIIIQLIRFRSVKGVRTAFLDLIGFIRISSERLIQTHKDHRITRYFLMVFIFGYAYFIYKGTSVAPHDYDVLSYHLPLAVDFSQNQSLIPGFHRYWHFWFPGNFEIWLSTWLFSGRSMYLSLTQLPSVIPIILFTYSLARSLGKEPHIAWISGLILAAAPILLFQSVSPMNEMFALPFLIGTVLYSVEFIKKQKSIDAIFAGCSLGLAIGTKYSFLTVIPAIFFAVLIALVFKKPQKTDSIRLLLKFAVLSLIPVLLLSFWYFRNYILKGNPFYPLELSILGTTIFSGIPTVFDPDFELHFVPSRLHWLIYPWIEGEYSSIQGWGYLVGGLGSIAFLIYVIKGIAKAQTRPIHVFLLSFSLIAIILWWHITQHEPRFLIFLLPLFAIYASTLFMRLKLPMNIGAVILLLVFSFTTGKAANDIKMQIRHLDYTDRFMSFYALPDELDNIPSEIPFVFLADCDYGHLLTYPLMGQDLRREVIVVGMEQFETDDDLAQFFEQYEQMIPRNSIILHYTTETDPRFEIEKFINVENTAIYRARGREGRAIFDRDNRISEYVWDR